MTVPSDNTRQEAERWFGRLSAGDCSESERAAFERWRQQSPRHADAYAATERLLARVDDLADSDPRIEALMRAARGLGPRAALASAHPRRRWLPPLALAASVIIAVIGFGFGTDLRRQAPVPVQYVSTDERRTITLDDGSAIELDVGGRLRVAFTAQQREVELQEGRAVFDVATDASRRFTVHAGGGSVTALGTRFQVTRERNEVTVTLAEGGVAVMHESAPGVAPRVEQLQPGEELIYSDDASTWTRQQADIEVAMSWTRGRLIFRDTPLAEVVAEVNRYSRRKLVLADPSLGELPVHGNFVSGDAERVASALEVVLPLRVDERDAEILMFPLP